MNDMPYTAMVKGLIERVSPSFSWPERFLISALVWALMIILICAR